MNLASPYPSDNRTLMATLRRQAGMPIGLPSWRWMLEIAMFFLRTEPELVLKSRWVLPGRLVDAGYRFRHPHLDEALADVGQRIRRRRARPTRSGRS